MDSIARGTQMTITSTFERYYHELREVLTDCRPVDFFEMYAGFAHDPRAGVADADPYDPGPKS
jgi:hypothetical protein